jgi:hypothetical protein
LEKEEIKMPFKPKFKRQEAEVEPIEDDFEDEEEPEEELEVPSPIRKQVPVPLTRTINELQPKNFIF